MNGHVDDSHAASAARRKILMENDVDDKVPLVSNLFQLDIYLDASDKLYDSFELFREKKQLDEAYIYGKRYVIFCIQQMVKHDYFGRGKYKTRCAASMKRSDHVLASLEEVVVAMDREEEEKERRKLEILRQQEEERRRRQREIEQRQIEELQKRIEAQKIKSPISSSQTTTNGDSSNDSTASLSADKVEESAMAKLHFFNNPAAAASAAQEQQQPTSTSSKNSVRWSLPPAEPDGHLLSQKSSESGSGADGISFPPPMLPPSATSNGTTDTSSMPPSYNSIVQQSSFFGPGKVNDVNTSANHIAPPAPAYDQIVNKSKISRPPKKVPIRKFVAETKSKHNQLLREGKIQIWPLKTYQGRIGGSTNGCTVISACVVSKHMETRRGVDDDQIQVVIDRECVPLLRAIRSKRDLGAASLIVPSDVHDYLVDRKLLYQHKFAGVAGGNIVDPEHAGEFLKLLQGEPGKTAHLKAGATLFFREHVVSIVKFPRGTNGDAIYDMVDSLPTLNGRGSRTRCHSLEAFRIHLAKYCTQKLTDQNLKYIEKNSWEDVLAETDPRVFQAFVWMDYPKPQ